MVTVFEFNKRKDKVQLSFYLQSNRQILNFVSSQDFKLLFNYLTEFLYQLTNEAISAVIN